MGRDSGIWARFLVARRFGAAFYLRGVVDSSRNAVGEVVVIESSPGSTAALRTDSGAGCEASSCARCQPQSLSAGHDDLRHCGERRPHGTLTTGAPKTSRICTPCTTRRPTTALHCTGTSSSLVALAPALPVCHSEGGPRRRSDPRPHWAQRGRVCLLTFYLPNNLSAFRSSPRGHHRNTCRSERAQTTERGLGGHSTTPHPPPCRE